MLVYLAAPPDFQIQPLAQGVDHRNSDSVQTAGNLVGVVVELSPGVQHSHDDFRCGFLGLMMKIGGDAAPVVDDRNAVVDVDGYFNS